jgi:hypothetical protein
MVSFQGNVCYALGMENATSIGKMDDCPHTKIKIHNRNKIIHRSSMSAFLFLDSRTNLFLQSELFFIVISVEHVLYRHRESKLISFTLLIN